MADDGDRVALTGVALDKDLYGDTNEYATTVVDEQDDDYTAEAKKGCATLCVPLQSTCRSAADAGPPSISLLPSQCMASAAFLA